MRSNIRFFQNSLVLCFLFILTFQTKVLASAATQLNEPPPWSWRTGSYGLSTQLNYFNSNSNFGQTRGEFVRLTGDSKYTEAASWFGARYAFWSRFSLYAGFGFSQIRAIDTLSTKTNTGMSDAALGGHFYLLQSWINLISQFEIGLPLASAPLSQTEPTLSDGVIWSRILLHARKDFGRFSIQGFTGMRFPGGGFAKTLQYGISSELKLNPVLIGAGIDGYEAVMSDQLQFSDRSTAASLANAGSYRFREFEPALLRAKAWVGFNAGTTIDFRLAYESSLSGLRSAHGQSIILSLVFNSIPIKRLSQSGGEKISAPGTTKSFKLESEATDPEIMPQNSDFDHSSGDDLNETERLLNQGPPKKP